MLGQTALDEKPLPNGKVNPTAPTFTAEYYMPAPETWAGKQINLSVAYVRPLTTTTTRTDGLQATHGGNLQRHGRVLQRSAPRRQHHHHGET